MNSSNVMRTTRLKDVCEFVKDGDWIETKDQGGDDYRLIQISNIGVGAFRETDNFRWITEETFRRLHCTEIELDDILVARMPDPTGRAWCVDDLPWKAVTAVDVAIIRTDRQQLNPRFGSYFLNSPKTLSVVQSLETGTTRKRIRRADLENLEILLPAIDKQERIAQVLGSLDDKIELNRRMNRTLEAMAQAIFKSWFVDFEPVKAKAAAKAAGATPEAINRAAMAAIAGKTEAELAQLPEPQQQALVQTAALFPESFAPSELGEIPAGWSTLPLDKVADYQNGLALQKFRPGKGEEALPVVKIAQLKTGEATWDELASASIKPECILDSGDVVFSWSGSLMVTLWCGGRAALNQHLFKITSADFPKWFYFSWTKKHLADFQRIAADKAVTMGHIKRSHLSNALCLIPTDDEMEEGTKILSPIVDLLVSNEVESRTLAQLRDTLLPKLLSGELSVPEAESLIERVTI